MDNAKPALITLKEHNRRRNEIYEWHDYEMRQGRRNGISCPKCGTELFDTQPSMTLTSNPPQKYIGCRARGCDYTGYRIA